MIRQTVETLKKPSRYGRQTWGNAVIIRETKGRHVLEMLQSYETIVAWRFNTGPIHVREFISQTTGRHVRAWLELKGASYDQPYRELEELYPWCPVPGPDWEAGTQIER